jgi:beta-glucosidase
VYSESGRTIGEAASLSSLELPGRQLELLQAVVGTGTPTVLLIMNGRPLDLRWPADNVRAILDIWYPGTQGGAAAANCSSAPRPPPAKCPSAGRVPSGRFRRSIPTPAPTNRNQGRRYWDEASTPLFPFGYGLSYADFSYSDLTVDQSSIPLDGAVAVSVQITNTSDREAAEVVQLYLH